MNEWMAVALLGIPAGALIGLVLAFVMHYRKGGVRDQLRGMLRDEERRP
jgi:hypothetical protein